MEGLEINSHEQLFHLERGKKYMLGVGGTEEWEEDEQDRWVDDTRESDSQGLWRNF